MIDEVVITEIKEKAAQAESESGALMEPGTAVKAKRGRPKKDKSEKLDNSKKANSEKSSESTVDDVPTKVILMPALGMVSQAAVKFARHPQAAMAPQEQDMMAELLSKLLDKYAPNALNRYGLEITCVVILGQYGARVYALKAAVDRAERAQAGHQNPGPSQAFEPEQMPKMTIVENPVDIVNPGPHADH